MNKEFLNFKEAMTLLGISASTLYKLTSSKSIPFYKPKGKIYFIKDELVEYVKNKKENVELNKNQN